MQAIDNKLRGEHGTVVFKNNIKHYIDFIKKFSFKYETSILKYWHEDSYY